MRLLKNKNILLLSSLDLLTLQLAKIGAPIAKSPNLTSKSISLTNSMERFCTVRSIEHHGRVLLFTLIKPVLSLKPKEYLPFLEF
jgi:hypothetical protein